MDKGDARAAATAYLAELKAHEDDETAWYNTGTAALAAGDPVLARSTLARAATSLDPELRFRALYNMGCSRSSKRRRTRPVAKRTSLTLNAHIVKRCCCSRITSARNGTWSWSTACAVAAVEQTSRIRRRPHRQAVVRGAAASSNSNRRRAQRRRHERVAGRSGAALDRPGRVAHAPRSRRPHAPRAPAGVKDW